MKVRKKKFNDVSFFLISDRTFRLDLIVIGEVRPTAEQIDRAKRLQLPLTFYLYENKSPCRGCRGCEIASTPLLVNSRGFSSHFDLSTRNLAKNFHSSTSLINFSFSN